MPASHKTRDLYRLLIRLENLKTKYKVPHDESFFDVLISATKALIDLTEEYVKKQQKIPTATERKIEKLYLAGETDRAIAKYVGVSKSTVNKIARKRGLFKNRPRSKQLHLFSGTTLAGDQE